MKKNPIKEIELNIKEEAIPANDVSTNIEKVSSHEIAMEILPLLKDFFCGEFDTNERGIIMQLVNQQMFQLTVEEM